MIRRLLLLLVVLFVGWAGSRPGPTRAQSPFGFSIAGGTPEQVAAIVPAGFRADPYRWTDLPNHDSAVQLIRPCHDRPLTARWQWCWDIAASTLRGGDTVQDPFANWAADPGLIWLVGNEPDNFNTGTGDDMTVEEYARFFGAMAVRITQQLRQTDPTALPKLVFCQATTVDSGIPFCEDAYTRLKALVAAGHWPNWPAGVAVPDVIHAIGIHHYAWTPADCRDWGFGPICYGWALQETGTGVSTPLHNLLVDWRDDLNRFVAWANTTHGGELADKPLWLTEYGVLNAFCNQAGPLRPGIDRADGVACPGRAARGNGVIDDDYVFYGRNEREGVWGFQRGTVEYFLNPTGDPANNQGDWAAAWWFVNHAGDWHNGDGECDHTGWLFGDDTHCTQAKDHLSPAGRTYALTLSCMTGGPCRLSPFAAHRQNLVALLAHPGREPRR